MWILEMVASVEYKGRRAVLGSFMDITERKVMEETLRQSEVKYRTILAEMDEAYFEVDLTGNYTYVNDAISRFLSYPKEELLGTTFRNQVNEEDTALLYEAFGTIFTTGKPVSDIAYG